VHLGVISGAAVVFFAFIGILGSLAIVTLHRAHGDGDHPAAHASGPATLVPDTDRTGGRFAYGYRSSRLGHRTKAAAGSVS